MYALASFGLRRSALLRSCSSEAGHGDVSTQLIQIDCLSTYHGFFIHDLSAQVMMLVYGTWTTHSHSLTPAHSLTPGFPLTLSLHSLTLTLTLTLTPLTTHSLTLTHSHSLTRSLSLENKVSYFTKVVIQSIPTRILSTLRSWFCVMRATV